MNLIPLGGTRIIRCRVPDAQGHAEEMARLKEDVRKDVTARLKRISGQVSGIQRMVDEDRYCVDVLLQVAAAEAALDRVGHLVLGSHIETCVSSALESGRPRDRKKKMDELLEVFSKFGRVRP